MSTKVTIGNATVSVYEFDKILDAIREINPAMAFEIEGLARFEEAET